MIASDNYVVVQREKSSRVLKVGKGQFVIDKLKFYFDKGIGHPYGTVFVVKNHHLCLNDDSLEAAATNMDVDSTTETPISSTERSENGDNVQQITREELHQMKKDGTSSNDIVTKLVEGCNTFKNKSSYAQEKYVARKNKKHSNVVCLLQPTIRLLNEIYYRKDPEKISFLRIDNLSLLLSMSNVHYGTKIIIVENCAGLIIAAVLERLGGAGVCLNLHKGDQQQSAPCLLAMNFPKEIMSTFYALPLNNAMNDEKPSEDDNLSNEINRKTGEKLTETDEKFERRERKRKALTFLNDDRFDSLILACKYHPLELLKRLYPKLETSRPFVLYCPYVQPLLDCYQWLRDQGTSVNLNLTENFYRRYQVLPDRTHPEMNQNVVSGFILSGVTVDK